MRRSCRAAWDALPLLLAVAAALAVPSCSRTPTPQVPDESTVSRPEQVSEEFVLTQTENGRKAWDLHAASGELFEGGDVVDLRDLAVDFFDSTGAHEGTLTARRGKIFRRQDTMEVEGDVVLTSADGAVLRTASLFWNDDEDRVTTDAYVEIDRKGSRLTGYGLVATPDLSFAEVQREVSVSGSRDGS